MKYSSLILLPLTVTLFACETGQLNSTYSRSEDIEQTALSNYQTEPRESQAYEQSKIDDPIKTDKPVADSGESEPHTMTTLAMDPPEAKHDESDSPLLDKALAVIDTPEDMTLNFSFDSTELTEGDIEQLIHTADFLVANPEYRVDISGFTDQIGAEDYNKSLSQKRADQVKSILKSRGVPAFQMTATGLGSSKPISSIAKQNRRVELTFEKTLFGLMEDSLPTSQPSDETRN